jgi:hypothetical protein
MHLGWKQAGRQKLLYGIPEAMTDVIAILGTLVDVNGRILIPGINDTVAPVTEDERSSYDPIDFDLVM